MVLCIKHFYITFLLLFIFFVCFFWCFICVFCCASFFASDFKASNALSKFKMQFHLKLLPTARHNLNETAFTNLWQNLANTQLSMSKFSLNCILDTDFFINRGNFFGFAFAILFVSLFCWMLLVLSQSTENCNLIANSKDCIFTINYCVKVLHGVSSMRTLSTLKQT